MKNLNKSKAFIDKYIGKVVEADLDGSLFDHVPATFVFRFDDPSELKKMLQEEYEDYPEDWDFDEVVPVAAVSSKGEGEDEVCEFAYVFLDWGNNDEKPEIVITTTDRWDCETGLNSIRALQLIVR